jgi:Ca2+-binding EF-hand superfamily protein
MEALRDVQNTGRLIFVLTDTNHDGLVSQQEAIDTNDLLVGGFFFRADADGNGVVSEAEAKAVIDKYLDQNPWLRYAVQSLQAQAQEKPNSGQQGTPPSPLQGFMALADTNNDKQLQATELRQVVQSLTQSYFAAADTNRDGKMSPSEVNAAVAGIAKSIAQQTFQQADTDHNGQLSRAEYDKAVVEPANLVFQIIDLNHDGQLSQQEADQVGRVLVQQVRMMQLPEPANSPTNLIESGKLPRETSPVPTFTAPATGNRTQPVAPR